jgi:hypothetical protein
MKKGSNLLPLRCLPADEQRGRLRNIGMVEYWIVENPLFQYSDIPSLHVSEEGRFFKLSEDTLKDLCHLTHRGISLAAFEKMGHDILLSPRSTFEIFQQL